jgi:two-component system chemotaxis response regulator CheY
VDQPIGLSTWSSQHAKIKDVPRTTASVSVLIVDDARPFRRVARDLLERRGYTVVGEADNAVSALRLAERLAPDAILLDVRLRDADGFQVASLLTLADPAPAVLLTSADVDLASYARLNGSGARGLVGKGQLAMTDLDRFWPRPEGSDGAVSPIVDDA